MAGPVPAIHVFAIHQGRKTWMPGTGPGMTEYYCFFPYSSGTADSTITSIRLTP